MPPAHAAAAAVSRRNDSKHNDNESRFQNIEHASRESDEACFLAHAPNGKRRSNLARKPNEFDLRRVVSHLLLQSASFELGAGDFRASN